MTLTEHAAMRMNQRAISPMLVHLLVQYGSKIHDHHGAEIYCFDKPSRRRLEKAVSKTMLVKLSGKLSVYMVLSDSNVITVGYRTKRIKRDGRIGRNSRRLKRRAKNAQSI